MSALGFPAEEQMVPKCVAPVIPRVRSCTQEVEALKGQLQRGERLAPDLAEAQNRV